VEIRRITTSDDLDAICAQMQPHLWGQDNEMTAYEPGSLKKFLETGNILVLVYEGSRIAGAAIASEILHPSKNADTLFINEVDTHPDFRRRGVATMLMEEMLKIARERSLSEAWVGADAGNDPAHELYKKLKPTKTEDCTNYDYKLSQSPQ